MSLPSAAMEGKQLLKKFMLRTAVCLHHIILRRCKVTMFSANFADVTPCRFCVCIALFIGERFNFLFVLFGQICFQECCSFGTRRPIAYSATVRVAQVSTQRFICQSFEVTIFAQERQRPWSNWASSRRRQTFWETAQGHAHSQWRIAVAVQSSNQGLLEALFPFSPLP